MILVETLKLLSRARQYVEDGKQCVLRQREIVELLEQRGRDPLEAILFLEDLEEVKRRTSLIGIVLSGKS